MSLQSRFIAWYLKLLPAETYEITIEHDLQVPMPDGAILLADLFSPRNLGKRPTILLRSPYGRSDAIGWSFSTILAERGFQVLIQSCRGTFGSGGVFNALRHERADGLATIEWLKSQPWFNGELATTGPSYLGFVQWAIAADAPPELKAMVTEITSSEFRSLDYPGESFALDTLLFWIHLVRHQEESSLRRFLNQFDYARKLRSGLMHLPLNEGDTIATGQRVAFYQDWLEHNQPSDPWWDAVDFSASLSQVSVPVHLIGGWYDIFLPQTLADYARLRQAGRQPYLTIGPWIHADTKSLSTLLDEPVKWLRAHLLGETQLLRKMPVRICVMGTDEWKEFPDWPPAGYTTQRWHLQDGNRLEKSLPAAAEPDRYRYDPADPTPSVGGSSLSLNSGPKDNRKLEARKDVLVYTSAPLENDLEVIGAVQAEVYARSSLEHTDFHARLCDVAPSGRSTNISDGLVRLIPGRVEAGPDGVKKVSIDLWATAHCFKRGHRIRLQVSSGAHPRFARNPGSGEPLGTATRLVSADQEVFHDPEHPSAILLPVRAK